MNKVKVVQQRESCIGCNACVVNAPQNWRINPYDGKSELIGSKKKGDLYVGEIFECDIEANKMAEMGCPMQVIKVED
ncbi:ferredoxin [Pseudomonadota bacterium]